MAKNHHNNRSAVNDYIAVLCSRKKLAQIDELSLVKVTTKTGFTLERGTAGFPMRLTKLM